MSDANLPEENSHKTYLVAGAKPWNQRVFNEVISRFSGQWFYIDGPDRLTDLVGQVRPSIIFFLHWSWRVPDELVSQYPCVCFHMADVPYGRGGSPLQNLIVRGHRQTKLSALKMVAELDAGPVYLKQDLSLEGGAEEVYIRATYLAAEMIQKIVSVCPQPVPQDGPGVVFKRRSPGESRIPEVENLLRLHDHIRMLDADGYPPAFLVHDGFRYEFRRSTLYDGRVEASVIITPEPKA